MEIQKNLKETNAKLEPKDAKDEPKDVKDDKLEPKDEAKAEIDIEAKCKILEEENQRLKNRIKEKDEGYNALINRILYEKNSYIHILESKLNSFYEAQAKAKAKA